MQLSIHDRPLSLNEVYGQPAIVKELSKRIKDNNLPTAFLFRGNTGVGKSTISKILAMNLVCPSPNEEGFACGKCMHCRDIISESYALDVAVLDGSSDSGKKEVVEFGKLSKMSPMYSKASVYIIEEMDQLSVGAKNSLLKTLENPSPNVYFILLSMMDDGVPKAIVDRCQTFRFKSFTTMDVMLALKGLLEKKGLWGSPSIPSTFFSDGLRSIAEASLGSLRAGVQALDKCLAGEFFTKEEMELSLNMLSVSTVNEMLLEACHLRRSVFEKIDNMDIQEILKLGYNNLSDALRYQVVGEAKHEFYENETKALADSPYLSEVTTVFEQVISTPIYDKKAYFTAKMVELYKSKKKRV